MDLSIFRRNRNYRFLFSATAVSNLGDGISALAFPWLATLITRDPFLISLTAAATRLPWLLFTLPAGVITARADRRRLMIGADIFRFVLTLGIVAMILAGPELPLTDGRDPHALIAILCGLAFLLGTAEVLRDNAAQTMLPTVVDKSDLENANGQMWSIEQIMGNFIGPPLAGVLIALAIPLPFAVDAVTFAIGALAIWMIMIPARLPRDQVTSFWTELKEGVTWIRAHPIILRLAVMLGLLNMASIAVLTMLVLFSQDILGLSAFGYGILLTAEAAGGVIGGLMAPRLIRAIGGRMAVLVSLAVFAICYALIAMTSSPIVVALALFASMFFALVWNVFTVSYRQRMIPNDILGRVNSIYRFFGWGMLPVGAVIAGLAVNWFEPSLGREAALRIPYWGASLLVVGLLIAAFWLLRFPDNEDPEFG